MRLIFASLCFVLAAGAAAADECEKKAFCMEVAQGIDAHLARYEYRAELVQGFVGGPGVGEEQKNNLLGAAKPIVEYCVRELSCPGILEMYRDGRLSHKLHKTFFGLFDYITWACRVWEERRQESQ